MPKAPAARRVRTTPVAVTAYGRMFRRHDAVPPERFTDAELLTVVLGNRSQAEAIMAECGGTIAGLGQLGSAKRLEYLPGVDRATVARVECLWEIACRVNGG